MQSITCEIEFGSPIEYVQVRNKACKENDMTIFVFEERNSGSSTGVRTLGNQQRDHSRTDNKNLN